MLTDTSIRKIFLARNPVQMHISYRMAKLTNTWINRNNNPKDGDGSDADQPVGDKPSSIAVNIPLLIKLISEELAFYSVCRNTAFATSQPIFTIDYSELFDIDKLTRLAEFLGLPGWAPGTEPSISKQITKSYKDIVENWAQVEQFLDRFGANIGSSFYEFMRLFNATEVKDFTGAPAGAVRPAPRKAAPGLSPV